MKNLVRRRTWFFLLTFKLSYSSDVPCVLTHMVHFINISIIATVQQFVLKCKYHILPHFHSKSSVITVSSIVLKRIFFLFIWTSLSKVKYKAFLRLLFRLTFLLFASFTIIGVYDMSSTNSLWCILLVFIFHKLGAYYDYPYCNWFPMTKLFQRVCHSNPIYIMLVNVKKIPNFHIYFVIFIMAKYNYSYNYIQPTQTHFKNLPTYLLFDVESPWYPYLHFSHLVILDYKTLLWVRISYELVWK